MPTRPDSPDPAGPSGDANPFATLGEGMGKGLAFFQDWMKAAGSALPHVAGAAGAGTGIPGWTAPTLDPAELDKRIQELRTVQFWLEQNARMIGMTIQGLEVQRMTLSTLQGMNVSMDQLKDALKVRPEAMQEMFKAAQPSPRATAREPAAAPATTPAAGPSVAAAADADAAPTPKPAAPRPTSAWFQGVPDEPEPEAEADDAAAGAGDSAQSASEAAAELINPMRWWDTLTQQFSHLASQAVVPGLNPLGAKAAEPAAGTPGAQASAATSPTAEGTRAPRAQKAPQGPRAPRSTAAHSAAGTAAASAMSEDAPPQTGTGRRPARKAAR